MPWNECFKLNVLKYDAMKYTAKYIISFSLAALVRPYSKLQWSIGTSYPKIATNFQSLYLAEKFALLLWNLLWWLLLPSFKFTQIFIIFHWVVFEIFDSSFLEFSKIRGPYIWLQFLNLKASKSMTRKRPIYLLCFHLGSISYSNENTNRFI